MPVPTPVRSDLAPPVLPPSAEVAPAAGEDPATLASPLASKEELRQDECPKAGAQKKIKHIKGNLNLSSLNLF